MELGLKKEKWSFYRSGKRLNLQNRKTRWVREQEKVKVENEAKKRYDKLQKLSRF